MGITLIVLDNNTIKRLQIAKAAPIDSEQNKKRAASLGNIFRLWIPAPVQTVDDIRTILNAVIPKLGLYSLRRTV